MTTETHGTGIGWTHVPGFKGETWNPTTGCDRVTPGCAHCYALEWAGHMKKMGQARYQRDGGAASGPGFGLTLHHDKLDEPLRWRKRRAVFVNSMSDLFHDEVPTPFIAAVFAVMSMAEQHIFMVLTKRPQRMQKLLTLPDFWAAVNIARAKRGAASLDDCEDLATGRTTVDNIWLGVTIENRRFVDRADQLRATPAAIRFISAEPLLGPLVPDSEWAENAQHERYHYWDAPIDAQRQWADGYRGPGLNLDEIDWLIVGGESGPHHGEPEHRTRFLVDDDGVPREDRVAWVRDLLQYCEDYPWQGERAGETAFFFKQWGGKKPKSGGRLLDGHEHSEFPAPRLGEE
jgi:protein gp37